MRPYILPCLPFAPIYLFYLSVLELITDFTQLRSQNLDLSQGCQPDFYTIEIVRNNMRSDYVSKAF